MIGRHEAAVDIERLRVVVDSAGILTQEEVLIATYEKRDRLGHTVAATVGEHQIVRTLHEIQSFAAPALVADAFGHIAPRLGDQVVIFTKQPAADFQCLAMVFLGSCQLTTRQTHHATAFEH